MSSVVEHWELVVIGAGPAGLTAGLYGTRSGLKTLIIESKMAGGLASVSPWIENYPGFPEGITGADLAERMVKQCKRFGTEIKEIEDAIKLEALDQEKIVKTDHSEYSADAVIIASGSQPKSLDVPGEKDFEGRGVSHCAICDGAFFKGKKVIVVGGGNTAVMSALYLSNVASQVYVAHRRDQLRAEEAYMKDLTEKRIRLLWNTEIKEILGTSRVESVVLFEGETGKKQQIDVDGVFIFVGESPNSEFAKKAGVRTDDKGYIIVDPLQRTNLPGIYAAGDVTTCPVKQIGTAVGQAIVAATEAFGYVKRPYYYQ